MEKVLPSAQISKLLVILNIGVLLVYLSWWFDFSHTDNPYLYGMLFFGEVYHAIMALTFWHTLWPVKQMKLNTRKRIEPEVDIFITVAGEPVDVVTQTINGAINIDYPKKRIYILNDSFVAGKDNWYQYEILAAHLGVNCITRQIAGGNKAGNINHGLRQTGGEVVVIFDADMVPHPDFINKVIPYFSDPKTGFVQTPQYYKNHNENYVAGGAWEQQEFFFGPIMSGKQKSNSAFMCGTNMAVRRQVLEKIGGMNEKNIAEDFLTSISIHKLGFKSYYVKEILAEGLAPEDLLSYFKQQLRWARGSLEVLFAANPLLSLKLTLSQKLEYLSSALFYFNGVVVLIDIAMPVIFLMTGIQPVSATTTSFAVFFVPFMALNLFTLYLASNGNFSFKAIAFSQSSWTLQIMALFSVLLRQKMAFAVTSKKALNGNFLYLIYPHIFYICIFIAAVITGIEREGLTPAVVTNIAWGIFNVIMFLPFIYASLNLKFNPEPKLALAKQL